MTTKQPPSRAFLITVTPGHELAQAFGHAAIAFDEGELITYSYGGYVLPPIRPKLSAGDLWELVGATAFETLLPVINQTSRVREDFARIEPGERKAGVYRYDHFMNNSVTRLRDQVLSSLEGEQIGLLYQ